MAVGSDDELFCDDVLEGCRPHAFPLIVTDELNVHARRRLDDEAYMFFASRKRAVSVAACCVGIVVLTCAAWFR